MLRSRFSFVLVLLLVGTVCAGSLVPVRGNGRSISVESASVSVTVGQEFTVQIWVRGVVGMQRISIYLSWDSSQVKRLVTNGNSNGRSGMSWGYGGSDFHYMDARGIDPPYTGDAYWWTVKFECLAEGTSTIQIRSDAEWYDGSAWITFDVVSGSTVTQTTSTVGPVGGIVVPTNSLAVLAPYLAVIGLFTLTAIVYYTKRT